jgi:hypothetical protein
MLCQLTGSAKSLAADRTNTGLHSSVPDHVVVQLFLTLESFATFGTHEETFLLSLPFCPDLPPGMDSPQMATQCRFFGERF